MKNLFQAVNHVYALLKELFWIDVPDAIFEGNGVDPQFIMSISTSEDYWKALQAAAANPSVC